MAGGERTAIHYETDCVAATELQLEETFFGADLVKVKCVHSELGTKGCDFLWCPSKGSSVFIQLELEEGGGKLIGRGNNLLYSAPEEGNPIYRLVFVPFLYLVDTERCQEVQKLISTKIQLDLKVPDEKLTQNLREPFSTCRFVNKTQTADRSEHVDGDTLHLEPHYVLEKQKISQKIVQQIVIKQQVGN